MAKKYVSPDGRRPSLKGTRRARTVANPGQAWASALSRARKGNVKLPILF